MITTIQDEFVVAFEAIHNIETKLHALQGEEVAKWKAGPISKRHELIRQALRDVRKANALLGNADYDHFLSAQL
jgi:hypothetical protein